VSTTDIIVFFAWLTIPALILVMRWIDRREAYKHRFVLPEPPEYLLAMREQHAAILKNMEDDPTCTIVSMMPDWASAFIHVAEEEGWIVGPLVEEAPGFHCVRIQKPDAQRVIRIYALPETR